MSEPNPTCSSCRGIGRVILPHPEPPLLPRTARVKACRCTDGELPAADAGQLAVEAVTVLLVEARAAREAELHVVGHMTIIAVELGVEPKLDVVVQRIRELRALEPAPAVSDVAED